MVVEKRSFIDKEKYEELKNLFTKENTLVSLLNQVIYKYKSELDFRLIRDKNQAYLRLRGSSVSNEDIIVNIAPKEVANLLVTLRCLGMYEELKWYRKRLVIQYQNYEVTLDETYQYGYVVSIGRTMKKDENKEEVNRELENLFDKLQISKITQEQFNDRYKYYKIHWVDLESKIDEERFLNQN